MQTAVGYKQKADSKNFNGTNKNKIQEEILKKHAEFQNVITDHPELQKLFDSKQVCNEWRAWCVMYGIVTQ